MTVVSASATVRPRRLDEEGLPFDDDTAVNPIPQNDQPADTFSKTQQTHHPHSSLKI